MKYLFIGIGKILILTLWAICQVVLFVWHCSPKHIKQPSVFYAGISFDDIGDDMLKRTIIFPTISIISAIFGFGGILDSETALIAKILFFIFLILFVLSLIVLRNRDE
jgi:uncharacterized membrane protein YtjA (UPF0391 family)